MIENAAREFYGLDLASITDAKDFAAVLRAADATIAESSRVERSRAIQQQILDTTTSNIRDGLEVFGVAGWQRVNDTDLNRQYGPPIPDPNRTAARALARRTTGKAIRDAVGASGRATVREGLTGPDGKPISLDKASGGLERAKREREDDIARSKGMLR